MKKDFGEKFNDWNIKKQEIEFSDRTKKCISKKDRFGGVPSGKI